MVVLTLAFRKKDPRAGFDKPKGYYEYFKQISIPFGEKTSGYGANYTLLEYNKAIRSLPANLKATADYTWVQRGPGNVGGRTRTVIIDPDDVTGKTWFAGSVGGGIWKTEDAGETWVNLTPNLPNLSTASLAMAAKNTDVIYAGTGEGYGGEGMIGGNGIYKSTDKGLNWATIESIKDDIHFRYVNKLWVSPSNEDIVIAATNRGIFKTLDGGVTWDSVYVKGYSVQDLAQNPLNENTLYAGVNSLGVIKSVDRGETWNASFDGMGECSRVSITVSPVDTAYLYAGVEGTSNETQIYHSRDAGNSWQLNYNADGLYTDFYGEQGWFNNVVAAHPFERSKVFVGGVNLGLLDFGLATYTGTRDVIRVDTFNTGGYLSFVSFGGSKFGGALLTGIDQDADVDASDFVSVEIRFNSSLALSQKAHRFTVPDGEGSGVPANQYTYQDYVEVPFEVWDVDNNKQLMVSFRDQDKNGKYNPGAFLYDNDTNSREYLFVHAIDYDAATPSGDIAVKEGYEYQLLYFLWPTLPEDVAWDENTIPDSKISILYGSIEYREAYTTVLADDNLNSDLHVDHHDIQFHIPDSEVDSFVILDANDGGLGYSIDKGATWNQINKGYLTTQFYGVAKRPGAQEYIGGMQDNGTWQSPLNKTAQQTSDYEFRVEGDGFETLWHPWYPQRILASSYTNYIKISNDFGASWKWIDNSILGDGPFITKLSHSRDNPNLVFAVGSSGVYRHTNFGFGSSSWQSIHLGDNWAVSNTVLSSHHVKVSKADPSVVWAGGAMYSEPDLNIYLSTDYGLTFDTVSNYTDSELGYISGMATHPTNPAEAFILFSFEGKPKVIRTFNYGQSWEDITGFAGHTGDSSINGFPDVIVHDLLVMPNDTNNIWVATEIGVFESIDNGVSWQYSNCGLPAVSVWTLDVVDGEVLAATHGRGIWTADLSISKITTSNKLEINATVYPNPATDFINIHINQQGISSAAVSLLDMSGRKLLSEDVTIESGESSSLIDVSFIQSGNYIVIIKAGIYSFTQKLIIQ
jgi:photosystem II stability/assembly factor-like uncharacterized protein